MFSCISYDRYRILKKCPKFMPKLNNTIINNNNNYTPIINYINKILTHNTTNKSNTYK